MIGARLNGCRELNVTNAIKWGGRHGSVNTQQQMSQQLYITTCFITHTDGNGENLHVQRGSTSGYDVVWDLK